MTTSTMQILKQAVDENDPSAADLVFALSELDLEVDNLEGKPEAAVCPAAGWFAGKSLAESIHEAESSSALVHY